MDPLVLHSFLFDVLTHEQFQIDCLNVSSEQLHKTGKWPSGRWRQTVNLLVCTHVGSNPTFLIK